MEVKRYLNGKQIEANELNQIKLCTKELEYAIKDARMRADKSDVANGDYSVIANG